MQQPRYTLKEMIGLPNTYWVRLGALLVADIARRERDQAAGAAFRQAHEKVRAAEALWTAEVCDFRGTEDDLLGSGLFFPVRSTCLPRISRTGGSSRYNVA